MRKESRSAVPAAEALQMLMERIAPAAPVEWVEPERALGRVVAAPAGARRSSPHFRAAAMDGFALRAADTAGAAPAAPVRLQLGAEAYPVNTGAPVPVGCDAVLMREEATVLPDGAVAVSRAVAPGQHVRQIGEEIKAGDSVLPLGRVIGPAEVGALLAAGVTAVAVRKQPVVTFVPTGTELVEPTVEPGVGQLVEFNSRMILAMVQEWGGQPRRHATVPDDRAALRAALEGALAASDIVVVNAGSSVGSEDYTGQVLAELCTVLVRGVALKPGRPVTLALCGGKPVLGLPGYPVAAWLTAQLFLGPVVERLRGARLPRRPTIRARMARAVRSTPGLDEYLRVRLEWQENGWVCHPLRYGAAAIQSLVLADGLVLVPIGRPGYAEGDPVEVELLRPVGNEAERGDA